MTSFYVQVQNALDSDSARMTPIDTSAAHLLEGLRLSGGWRVLEMTPRVPGASGGTFSVGYLVQHEESGRKGFLKALDFSGALRDLRELQRLLQEYNFERDILTKCRDRRLSRVVTAIEQGTVTVEGYEPAALAEVHYLIFDFATGDLRSQMESAHLVWSLTVAHEVAVALRQLHRNGIAHQDVKPSNVLAFEGEGNKVADLGSAVDRAMISPHDDDTVGGDPAYAPPEQLYRHVQPDWDRRRMGGDMYLLGSLLVFLFTTVGTTAAVISRMHGSIHYMFADVTFEQMLPYWRKAFEEVLAEFENAVLANTRGHAGITAELVSLVREFCEPDPSLRGQRGLTSNQFNLERYVTRLDVVRSKANLHLRSR